MRKKIIILMLLGTIFCSSCARGEEKVARAPQITQMKAICELATLECYYHHVAKVDQKDVERFLLWDKDLHFWVEYEGKVKIGIDTSLVKIEVNDNKVDITLPPAYMQEYTVESFAEDAIVVAKDSVKVTAELEVEAMKLAKEEIKNLISEEKALLESARQRAQKLLSEYVKNIGEQLGIQYEITWIDVDKDGNIVK